MKVVIGKCSSKKVTIRATFDAGAATEYEGEWQPGTAHLMEHMIFQGSSELSNEELTKKLATLGADWNGFTWHDKVSFYINVPVENAVEAAHLLQTMLFNREFDENLFEKEKLVVLEEERGTRDDLESKVIEELDKFICSGPLATSIIGTSKTIQAITFDDIENFYEKFYQPENLLLVITGPGNTDFKAIEDVFGENTGKFTKFAKCENIFTDKKYKRIYDERISQARVFVIYKAYPFTSKNSLTLAFADKFLGDDMDSRLFQSIRQKRGLCYTISSFNSVYKDVGWYVVAARTAPENVKKVVKLIDKEIINLLENGPDEEEMLRARNKYISDIYSVIETSYGLNSMLGTRAFNNLPDLEASIERIKNMTVRNIKSVCSKVFKPENRQLFTYMPKK